MVPPALLVALVAALFAQSGGAEGQAPRVAAVDLKKFVGRDVTVCGRVVTYDCEQSSGALLFDLDLPGWKNGPAVEIGREQWAGSGGQDLANRYVGAQICAHGTVRRTGSRYRVAVRGDAPQVVRASDLQALATDARQSCAEGVTPPKLAREVKPSYTREAMKRKLEGTVFMDAVVLPDGSVGDIRVLSGLSPDYGLNQQAIAALKEWGFRPGSFGARSVPVAVTVELSFTLR